VIPGVGVATFEPRNLTTRSLQSNERLRRARDLFRTQNPRNAGQGVDASTHVEARGFSR